MLMGAFRSGSDHPLYVLGTISLLVPMTVTDRLGLSGFDHLPKPVFHNMPKYIIAVVDKVTTLLSMESAGMHYSLLNVVPQLFESVARAVVEHFSTESENQMRKVTKLALVVLKF